MSTDAIVPCFSCGKTLKNAFPDEDNQPSEGTEFRTYGHYGSTFWDSFDGEELVLNVCDDCLRAHTDRLAQHKRFLPVHVRGAGTVGRQWIQRPMVAYTGARDEAAVTVDADELSELGGIERY